MAKMKDVIRIRMAQLEAKTIVRRAQVNQATLQQKIWGAHRGMTLQGGLVASVQAGVLKEGLVHELRPLAASKGGEAANEGKAT